MKIIVVGDSYTYGQGCSDRVDNYDLVTAAPSASCWASLLQKQYPSLTVRNYSQPGADNPKIIRFLHKNLEQDVDLVIFCSTFISRIPVRCPGNDNDLSLTISPQWSELEHEPGFNHSVMQYFKHLYSDLVGYNLMTNCLMAAYGFSKLVNADFRWTHPMCNFMPGPNNQIFEQMAPYKIKSSADLNYKYSEFASCMHPNDAGHARYFEEVIAPMIELFLKDRNGN